MILTPPRPWKNELIKNELRDAVYRGQSLKDFARLPLLCGMGLLVFGLPVAISKDKQNAQLCKQGRPLRGPEEVTAAEFNRRNRSDGIGFGTLEPPAFSERLLRRNGTQVCIPRSIEDNHFLFMGDSGSGKSSLIRQVLAQIAERGETAVVYDPALEYIGQFYSPQRGDVILNPLDQRMPYWSPCDEVTRPSEALTLAASLFQETDRENPFFVQGPRKIFAYLLNLKPTTDELLGWLSDERELERRLKGTPLAAMIYESAGPQRGGMFASLSMVADSLRLLPDKVRSVKKFTVAEWAQHRQGWVFVTSIPEAREQLRPLISMWLDMMILRLMNQGRRGPAPGLVCAGRVVIVAQAAAVAHGDHRKPEGGKSRRAVLSGAEPVGGHLRPPGGSNALPTSDQNLPENQRATSCPVDQRHARRGRDRETAREPHPRADATAARIAQLPT